MADITASKYYLVTSVFDWIDQLLHYYYYDDADDDQQGSDDWLYVQEVIHQHQHRL